MKTKLNDAGIKKFNEYLNSLLEQPSASIPQYLLNDPETSSPLGYNTQFDGNLVFSSRHTCGEYVAKQMQFVEKRDFLDDRALWSSLALLWFDQLCPDNAKGERKPQRYDNYILELNQRQVMRHSIRTSWQLVATYGDDARYLQSGAMRTRGELIEQILSTPYYINCEGVMQTASLLYSDPSTGSFKKGSGNKDRGGARRYIAWLRQVRQNYDLFSLSQTDLVKILPSEFSRFLGR